MSGTILLTGATGFVGFAILLKALKTGHHVRIIVYSENEAERLRTSSALFSLNKSSQFSFCVVPDPQAPGALDAAATGAEYIIHVASPLPFQPIEPEQLYDAVVKPAVNFTLNILSAAKNSGSVKRVVCTSSAAAFVSPSELLGADQETTLNKTEEDANDDVYADLGQPIPDVMTAYVGSKTAAFQRSKRWMEEHGGAECLEFDLVNVAPTYVFGRHEAATSVEDLLSKSNALVLGMVVPKKRMGAAPLLSDAEISSGVHVDDVVDCHLMALDRTKIPGGETFLLSMDPVWNDVPMWTRRLFPKEVDEGLLTCHGQCKTKKVRFLPNKARRAFGIEFKGMDSVVRDVVGQYLELIERS
ncbi:uncharacterized protein J3D65DRAFT_690000 [Phyllosticta citribraziliensis]|uniref:NAD-dependent epimerase/dehydratase domain-containing protein n=1 Tax=Phyllosticta citribraziliensis TaxID=989973 RepID=A0ABR1M3P5_9PEZI